jgi:hypothetical protein
MSENEFDEESELADEWKNKIRRDRENSKEKYSAAFMALNEVVIDKSYPDESDIAQAEALFKENIAYAINPIAGQATLDDAKRLLYHLNQIVQEITERTLQSFVTLGNETEYITEFQGKICLLGAHDEANVNDNSCPLDYCERYEYIASLPPPPCPPENPLYFSRVVSCLQIIETLGCSVLSEGECIRAKDTFKDIWNLSQESNRIRKTIHHLADVLAGDKSLDDNTRGYISANVSDHYDEPDWVKGLVERYDDYQSRIDKALLRAQRVIFNLISICYHLAMIENQGDAPKIKEPSEMKADIVEKTESGKKKRGRPSDTDPKKDAELFREWKRYKEAGHLKPEFANDQSISVNELNRALDRHQKRLKNKSE